MQSSDSTALIMYQSPLETWIPDQWSICLRTQSGIVQRRNSLLHTKNGRSAWMLSWCPFPHCCLFHLVVVIEVVNCLRCVHCVVWCLSWCRAQYALRTCRQNCVSSAAVEWIVPWHACHPRWTPTSASCQAQNPVRRNDEAIELIPPQPSNHFSSIVTSWPCAFLTIIGDFPHFAGLTLEMLTLLLNIFTAFAKRLSPLFSIRLFSLPVKRVCDQTRCKHCLYQQF